MNNYYVVRSGNYYLGLDGYGFVGYVTHRSDALKFYSREFATNMISGIQVSENDSWFDDTLPLKVVKVVSKSCRGPYNRYASP